MSELQLGQMRIPDILETIADLSNDEVFTPPQLANKVLDTLPEEIWSNSKITFLDPACKTGVFLREIAKRLIVGLEEEIPDLQERVNHILTKQVYGLGITELTALMSRRTVYCATKANSEASVVTAFDNEEGNIKFPKSKHIFNEKTKKCEVCGAGKDLYEDIEGLDNYAYSFLHDNLKEVFGNVKFDVIIGNPPYHFSNGEDTAARPLYNLFVERAIKMEPKYISMITPSRWMKGGKGLDKFREKMIADSRIKEIHDFQNDKEVFPNNNIDGGVNYFLWCSDYNGLVDYHYYNSEGKHLNKKRYLKIRGLDIVIRDTRQVGIIEKVLRVNRNKKTFDSIVSPIIPFGIKTYLFNEPEKYPNIKLSEEKEDENSILIYGVEGYKGGARRVSKYMNRSGIEKSIESIDKYKLFFSRTYTTSATVPPKFIYGVPGTVCTQTFLKIGDFNTEKEMSNCLSYFETKLFRALLSFKRASFAVSRSDFEFIPLEDFSKKWNDTDLYKKYKLDSEEIAYIEENIDKMSNEESLENDTLTEEN